MGLDGALATPIRLVPDPITPFRARSTDIDFVGFFCHP